MSDKLKVDGQVVEALRGARFRVKVEGRDELVLCNLSGKMYIHHINVFIGDKVQFDIGPDWHLGRIIRRY